MLEVMNVINQNTTVNEKLAAQETFNFKRLNSRISKLKLGDDKSD